MSAYELYVLAHVSGAIVWVGSAFLMTLLGMRASVSREPERAVQYAADSAWLGLRVYLPANLLVLASALLLVHDGPWSYDPLWIKLGYVGFALSFLIGALFFGPGWPRVVKLAAVEGAASPAVRGRIRGLHLGTRLDLGLLLGIVFVMTVKPSADETGALALAAAIPLVFVVFGLALYWADARRASAASVAAEAR